MEVSNLVKLSQKELIVCGQIPPDVVLLLNEQMSGLWFDGTNQFDNVLSLFSELVKVNDQKTNALRWLAQTDNNTKVREQANLLETSLTQLLDSEGFFQLKHLVKATNKTYKDCESILNLLWLGGFVGRVEIGKKVYKYRFTTDEAQTIALLQWQRKNLMSEVGEIDQIINKITSKLKSVEVSKTKKTAPKTKWSKLDLQQLQNFVQQTNFANQNSVEQNNLASDFGKQIGRTTESILAKIQQL